MPKTTYTARWDDAFGYGARQSDVTTEVVEWQRKAALYDQIMENHPELHERNAMTSQSARALEREAKVQLVNRYGGLSIVGHVLRAVFDLAAQGDEHRGMLVRNALKQAQREVEDTEKINN